VRLSLTGREWKWGDWHLVYRINWATEGGRIPLARRLPECILARGVVGERVPIQGVKLWLARQTRQPLNDLRTPGFFSAIRIVAFARITEQGKAALTAIPYS